jgi:hypothetical protein
MGDDEKFIYTPTLPPTRTHTQLQKFKLGDKIKQYQEMLSLYAQVTMQDLYAPDFNIAGAVNHIVQSSLFSHLIPPEPAPVIAGTPSTIWKAKIAKLTAAVRLAILIPPELAQVIQTKLAGNDGNGGGVSWGTLHAFGTCTIKMPCLFWRKSDFPDESGFVDRDYHNFLCHRARQIDYAVVGLKTGVVNSTHQEFTRLKAWISSSDSTLQLAYWIWKRVPVLVDHVKSYLKVLNDTHKDQPAVQKLINYPRDPNYSPLATHGVLEDDHWPDGVPILDLVRKLGSGEWDFLVYLIFREINPTRIKGVKEGYWWLKWPEPEIITFIHYPMPLRTLLHALETDIAECLIWCVD